MRGISSWYGPNFHGKMTSNGERYNMHARTAAHKTWPMNTIVKVTNLQNGKSTVVRINDRGPFVKGRIIDCSYLAGKEIGLDRMGIAKVEIEVLSFPGHKRRKTVKIARKKVQKKEIAKTEIVQKEVAKIEVPKSEIEAVKLTNFGLQLGAFSQQEGAKRFKESYIGLDKRYNPIIKVSYTESGDKIYRVWLMGFSTEEEARDFKQCQNLQNAIVVRN